MVAQVTVDDEGRLMGSADAVTGPINLGNDAEFTMRQLAQRVIELTNSKSTIVHLPMPADDPRQRKPDTRLAESTLNWRATTALDEGLRATIAYFDHLLSGRPGDPAGETRGPA